jgi:hypothetical protein
MSEKYWEEEAPVCIRTDSNVFRHFPKAEKLQVCGPDWVDKDGVRRQGKTVTVDLMGLKKESTAFEFLRDLINGLD